MVAPFDDQKIHGPYKRYYENGNLEMEGNYLNGVRSGTFYEYHESGTRLRIINYKDGKRDGTVEVFDEDGRILQKGFYKPLYYSDIVSSNSLKPNPK